jgi:hypothetical protein
MLAGYDRKSDPFSIVRLIVAAASLLLVFGCGYRFTGGQEDNPFPPEIKTVVLQSAVNKTIVTGIETELTNELRQEFAVGTRLKPVRSDGDSILKTIIASYEDTPSSYKADGKELTRTGILRVASSLNRADNNKVLWQRELAASYPYNVTDTISETLSNRRRAISRMIKDVIPRLHRSLYDHF